LIDKAAFVYFRLNGASSTDYFRLYIADTTTTSDCAVQRRYDSGGAGTVTGSVQPVTITNGDTVDVKITVSGLNYTVEVIGHYSFSFIDSDPLSRLVNNQFIGAQNAFISTRCEWDEFKVYV
jgi:hypothetical protein